MFTNLAATSIVIATLLVSLFTFKAPPADKRPHKRTPTPTATFTSTPTPLPTATATPVPLPTSTAMPPPVPTTPPSGSIYWGAYVDGAPFDMAKLATFEADAQKPVSIVHWGEPWFMNGSYMRFQSGEADKVRAHGSIPMINWGSWALGAGLNQPDYTLQQIYLGKHDAYVTQWALDVKAWGHPLFLRFDHEMNGWWFPWAEQVNNNQPGDYVKAWRHVHDIFAQVGATNVTWVWCPNITDSAQSTPVAGLYPGDAYVDWVAMDGYNWGTDKGNQWQTFSQVFKHTYDELGALAPSKPLMIAEFASSEDGGSKADWIRDAFTVQLPTYFPRIKAVVWFNWNDNDPTLDWPIGSSAASVQALSVSVAWPYYATNTFDQSAESPIPEPKSKLRSTLWVPIALVSLD